MLGVDSFLSCLGKVGGASGPAGGDLWLQQSRLFSCTPVSRHKTKAD